MDKPSKFEQIEDIFIDDPLKLKKAYYVDHQRKMSWELVFQLHHAETVHNIKFKIMKLIKRFDLQDHVMEPNVDALAVKIKAVLDADD